MTGAEAEEDGKQARRDNGDMVAAIDERGEGIAEKKDGNDELLESLHAVPFARNKGSGRNLFRKAQYNKKGLALAGKPENEAIAQNSCGGRIPLSLTDSREKTLFFQLQVLKHLISSEQIEQKRKIQVRPRGKNDPIQPAFLVTPPSQ